MGLKSRILSFFKRKKTRFMGVDFNNTESIIIIIEKNEKGIYTVIDTQRFKQKTKTEIKKEIEKTKEKYNITIIPLIEGFNKW